MKYLIVENGIITNIIVAAEAFAEAIGAKAFYDGATIGGKYAPPIEPTIELLSAQLKAATDRGDFLENCIAEMATKVYAQ